MEMTKTNKIIISAVAVIILLAVYISFDKRSKNESVDEPIITEETATITDSTNGIKTTGTGSYTIEQVGFDEPKPLPPAPDLNRTIVVYPGTIVSPEAKDLSATKILDIQNKLKTDPKNFELWINLGIYQKMAGDYEGAVLSWRYTRALFPNDYISVANLGNIYAYYLKDNGMAETYYKEAISKGPTQAYLYTQLAEIYRDIFKDLDKARAIVDQGLAKVPNDANLLQLQQLLK